MIFFGLNFIFYGLIHITHELWVPYFMAYDKDPDGEIENCGKTFFKSRMQHFCYIQVIVFDLSLLNVLLELFTCR